MVNDKYNGNGKCPVMPGDNIVSRINTPPGMYIEVYRDFFYKGKRWVFGNLNSEMSYGLWWLGANDRISSFIIRQVPSGGVKLCQDMDCENGKIWRSVGSYKSMPWEIGDNDLSRVVLPPNFTIKIFVKGSFKGSSELFINGHATMYLSIEFRNEHILWDDKVSSFIISSIS
jgi:hypothetical protein